MSNWVCMQKFTLVGDLVKLWLSNIKTDRQIEQFIQEENIENYKPEVILSLIDSFTRENLQLALKQHVNIGSDQDV